MLQDDGSAPSTSILVTVLPELRDEAVDEDGLAQLPDFRDVVQQAEHLQSGEIQ